MAGSADSAARLGRIVEFQQGERVAVIGVAAIVAGPRMTFIILLAWGLVAACLSLIGGIVRSVHPMSRDDPQRPEPRHLP